MHPGSVARSALRWDAAFCALAGSLAVVVWAGIVWGMARADSWWGPAITLAAVNLVGACVLAVWAVSTAGPGGAVRGLVAAQVFCFSVAQGAAAALGWRDRVA